VDFQRGLQTRNVHAVWGRAVVYLAGLGCTQSYVTCDSETSGSGTGDVVIARLGRQMKRCGAV